MGTASGRNKSGNERDPHDYYPTPAWSIYRMLEKVSLPTKNSLWFEPASGGGALVNAVHSWCSTQHKDLPKWMTNDIRSDAVADYYKDFSSYDVLSFYQEFDIDVVITNPPFALADRFLEHSLKLHNAQGTPPIIVFLLRMQWMATHGRALMMQQHTPTLAILPDRPNFTTTGNSDMCEYAWHIWNHPDVSYQERVIVLDATDVRERKGKMHLESQGPQQKISTLFGEIEMS